MLDRADELRQDYDQTNQLFRTLADIRFKLLAFVPTLTGIALATMAGKEGTGTPSKAIVFATGLLGAAVTLGIIVYELRNTALYNTAIHRAKQLEVLLNSPTLTNDRPAGGLHNERPPTSETLFPPLLVQHDRGLALIYSASMSGWVYLIVNSVAYRMIPASSIIKVFSTPISTYVIVSTLVAMSAGVLLFWRWTQIGKHRDSPKPYVFLDSGHNEANSKTKLSGLKDTEVRIHPSRIKKTNELNCFVVTLNIHIQSGPIDYVAGHTKKWDNNDLKRKELPSGIRPCNVTMKQEPNGRTLITLSPVLESGPSLVHLAVKFKGARKTQPYFWKILVSLDVIEAYYQLHTTLEEEKVKLEEEKVKLEEEKVKLEEEKAKLEEEKAKLASDVERLNQTLQTNMQLYAVLSTNLKEAVSQVTLEASRHKERGDLTIEEQPATP